MSDLSWADVNDSDGELTFSFEDESFVPSIEDQLDSIRAAIKKKEDEEQKRQQEEKKQQQEEKKQKATSILKKVCKLFESMSQDQKQKLVEEMRNIVCPSYKSATTRNLEISSSSKKEEEEVPKKTRPVQKQLDKKKHVRPVIENLEDSYFLSLKKKGDQYLLFQLKHLPDHFFSYSTKFQTFKMFKNKYWINVPDELLNKDRVYSKLIKHF